MQQWIKDFLEQFGFWGIGVLMLIENVFPPIPSEVVMPWAGYAVSRGDLSFIAAITAGSTGSFAGAMFWYGVAVWVGQQRLARWVERHGGWLTIEPKDLRSTERWFQKWGSIAVLLCRMVPGIRTLISIPAGFAGMPIGRFSLFTAIGTVLWTVTLAALGWWLADNYVMLAGPLSWVSLIVIGALFAWWLYRMVRQAKRTRNEWS